MSVDLNRQQKAHKYGLRPFMVGTQRAKDLILGVDAQAGRIKLIGDGAGRMHWYKSVRPDYWEQIVSEVKAPHRTIRGRKVWQKKSGVRNEALDCEVYALHAVRSLKTNLWKDSHWDQQEQALRQVDLLSTQDTSNVATADNISTATAPDAPEKQTAAPITQPKKPVGLFNHPRQGGWTAKIRG
jgi:phage terminase large subunit GpA-like protein